MFAARGGASQVIGESLVPHHCPALEGETWVGGGGVDVARGSSRCLPPGEEPPESLVRHFHVIRPALERQMGKEVGGRSFHDLRLGKEPSKSSVSVSHFPPSAIQEFDQLWEGELVRRLQIPKCRKAGLKVLVSCGAPSGSGRSRKPDILAGQGGRGEEA